MTATDHRDATGRPPGSWKLIATEPPKTWKGIAVLVAVALGEIAYALHRVAGALEDAAPDEEGLP